MIEKMLIKEDQQGPLQQAQHLRAREWFRVMGDMIAREEHLLVANGSSRLKPPEGYKFMYFDGPMLEDGIQYQWLFPIPLDHYPNLVRAMDHVDAINEFLFYERIYDWNNKSYEERQTRFAKHKAAYKLLDLEPDDPGYEESREIIRRDFLGRIPVDERTLLMSPPKAMK